MKIAVDKFNVVNEMDIVLAHRRAGQLCDLTGLGFYTKTSFITGVSEICRNVIEHAKSGKITFYVYNDGSMIEAMVTDHGKGINNADYYLTRPFVPDVKGCGLQNAKKLVDVFNLQTSENGTIIELGMKTNSKTVPVNPSIIKEWERFFNTEKPASPYEEIKRQNNQLLEITDQLRIKNMETASQLEEIKQLNVQLNKSNQELEDFASTLSHDLRSPIANLKMFISIIENSGSSKERDYTDKLKSQVDRLDDMIMGLAEIIDLKNTQNILASRVNFQDILNVINEELKRQADTTNSKIISDFSSQSFVNYYEVYLHSIMLNLVSNAIKYRADTPPVIKITSGREGRHVVLTVEDNGIGMDLQKIGNELFKPFRRFHTIREGKGIGLHIIKGMVEKNGGYIEVKSEPGKGTRFKVYMVEYMD
jgi:signal transduction histidine kinase